MADYNSMKVPELKKLLNERGLVQTGNKAELIKRLQGDDDAKAAEAGGDKAGSGRFLFPSPPKRSSGYIFGWTDRNSCCGKQNWAN